MKHAFLSYSFDLLRYKKGITFVNILCNAVIFSHYAAVTFCVRQVLNGLEDAQGQALAGAWPYLVGILLLAIVRIAAIMGCATLDALRTYYYRNRTRLNALRFFLRKEDVTEVSGHASQLFEVLDDDVAAATFPAELLTEVTGYFIHTLISLSILLSINWALTLFIFLPLSAAIYGVQRLSERMKERRRINREAHDEASLFIGDIADAALAVKVAGAQESVLNRYDRVNAARRGAVIRDAVFNERVSVLLQGAVCIGSAVMMFMAARVMGGDAFGIGDFSLFIVYLGTLADCVNRIVELTMDSRKAEVSYERLLKGGVDGKALSADVSISLKKEPLPEPTPATQEPLQALEIRSLSYTYSGEDGFHDVSFSVYPGELIAIAGGMASGKSTLLGALMGLIPAQGGEVLWNGEPLTQRDLRIAGAPQRGGFFSSDIGTNIALSLPLSEADMLNALHLAALDGAELSADVGGQGDRLSGGQRQRLALARLFARNASVNIIDDCVSALDEATQTEVLRRLTEYLKSTGHAAIVATNATPFLESADRVVYMENGRVTQS